MTAAGKRRLGLAVRAAGSLGLLVYLFSRVKWQDVTAQLAAADGRLLALYVLLGLAGVLVSAAKWRLLSRPLGLPAGLGRLFLLYLVGYFFNNLLPTSFGGDVVRVWEQGRPDGRHEEAAAAVFMERFSGLTTLILCVLLALAAQPAYLADRRMLAALAVGGAGYALVSWLVLGRGALALLRARVRWAPAARIFARAAAVQDALYRYRHHRGVLAGSAIYSMVFYALTVLIVDVGCRALGVRVPLGELATAVPLMLLLFSIPLSIGGIGLQEWAYYFVLTRVGVPPAVALGLGVLFRLRTLAFSAVGGAVYPLLGGSTAGLTSAALRPSER